jgi:hypothetical protein
MLVVTEFNRGYYYISENNNKELEPFDYDKNSKTPRLYLSSFAKNDKYVVNDL